MTKLSYPSNLSSSVLYICLCCSFLCSTSSIAVVVDILASTTQISSSIEHRELLCIQLAIVSIWCWWNIPSIFVMFACLLDSKLSSQGRCLHTQVAFSVQISWEIIPKPLNLLASNAQINSLSHACHQLLCVGYVLWPSHSPECCVVLSVQWIQYMAHHKWQMNK